MSSVMQTVSGKRNQDGGEDRFKELKKEIESQTSVLYSTARLWDDGIIAPSETRDVLGLGLELAAEEKASRTASSNAGGRGEVGADGDAGDWGVFRM